MYSRIFSTPVVFLSTLILLMLSCQTLVVADVENCFAEFEKLYQRDGSILNTSTLALMLTCISLKLCKYSYSPESLKYIESVDRTDPNAFIRPDHPMVGSFYGDISQLEGAAQHRQLHSVCNDLQGTTITATGILDLEGTAMTNVDVDVFIYLKDLPICMPAACEGQDVQEFSEVAGKKIMLGLAKNEQEKYTDKQIDQLSGMTSRSACLFLGIDTCTFEVCEDAAECGSYDSIVSGELNDRFSAAVKQYSITMSNFLVLLLFLYAAILL